MKPMKRTLCILTLAGLFACPLAGLAQNNSPEQSSPASANSGATPSAGKADASNASAVAAEANPANPATAPATPGNPAEQSATVEKPSVSRNRAVAANDAAPATIVAANDTAQA